MPAPPVPAAILGTVDAGAPDNDTAVPDAQTAAEASLWLDGGDGGALIQTNEAGDAATLDALAPDSANVEDALAETAQPNALESVQIVSQCDNTFAWDGSQLNLQLDVVYNQVDGTDLKLDIASPVTKGPHPMVMVIHGGGWYFGQKEDHRSSIQYLASLGYVAVAVEYRLMQYPDGGSQSFPAAAQDVRCAARWLKVHAGNYDADPTRMAAMGDSAGGHLASLLGTESDVAGLDGPCSVSTLVSPRVDAVVAYYPVEDVRVPLSVWSESTMGLNPRQVILSLLQGTPEAKAELAERASPMAHIDPSDAPFLLLHGKEDTVVPVSQSRDMYRALQQGGVRATYVELAGQGHAFPLFGFSQSYYAASCTTVAFLNQYLRP